MTTRVAPLHLVGDAVPELEELLRRCAGGERRAQEDLFRQFVQFVGHVARAAGAGSELEDVVQDTFIEMFASLPTLERPAAIRPWLARLAVRQVQRRTRWRPWLQLFLGPRDEAASFETLLDASASAETRLEVRELEQALAKVGPEVRLCWLLRHWHGMTLEETATATGLSLATTKRRLQAAALILDTLRQEGTR